MLSFVVFSLCLGVALCRPEGAPENERVCIEMNPQHGNFTPQETDGPYSMTLSQDTYLPGDIIQMTIEANEGGTFRGFTAQARRVSEEEVPIGTMVPLGDGESKNVCDDYAITHTNNTDKVSVSFDWQAPAASEGDLEIYFSVVDVFDTFWIRMRSEPLFAALAKEETLANY